MADVKQKSGVKQIIVTIPVSADDGGGGNIKMMLEDFCKLDISQTTMARLQEQTQSDMLHGYQVIIHPMVFTLHRW